MATITELTAAVGEPEGGCHYCFACGVYDSEGDPALHVVDVPTSRIFPRGKAASCTSCRDAFKAASPVADFNIWHAMRWTTIMRAIAAKAWADDPEGMRKRMDEAEAWRRA